MTYEHKTVKSAGVSGLLENLPPAKRKATIIRLYCASQLTQREVEVCFGRWPEMVKA
mgnify:FL=1